MYDFTDTETSCKKILQMQRFPARKEKRNIHRSLQLHVLTQLLLQKLF